MANLTIAENSENRKKIENCGKLAEFTERQQKCGKWEIWRKYQKTQKYAEFTKNIRKTKKLSKKQKMRKTQTESCFKKCGKIGENKRTEEKLGKRE